MHFACQKFYSKAQIANISKNQIKFYGMAARMAGGHSIFCLPTSRTQNNLHNERDGKFDSCYLKNNQNARQLPH